MAVPEIPPSSVVAAGAKDWRLSVVVPVLDEESGIAATLAAVRAELCADDELIVVDGRSRDRTVELAAAAGAQVVESGRGRGRQMNLGAARASGDLLLFLHADTALPPGARAALGETVFAQGADWGRFDLEFDAGGPLLRLIAWLISTRSRIFRSATGDQAIFVRRCVFAEMGGHREEQLFEDVELVLRLKASYQMGIPRGRVVTSSRRWRNRGVWSTTLTMWSLKTLYLLGVPSEKLMGFYKDER